MQANNIKYFFEFEFSELFTYYSRYQVSDSWNFFICYKFSNTQAGREHLDVKAMA